MQWLTRSRFRFVFLFLIVSGIVGLMSGWSRHSVPPASPHAAIPAPPSRYGQVPLSFEANHGQAKEPVQYLARGTNATLYLTPNEAALEVRGSKPATSHQPPTTALVKMKLLGANAQPRLQGEQELPGKSNYFSGKEASLWKTNIPTYQQVRYEQVYEGIDLVYYGNQQQLEYDFIVQPGADPDAIKLRFEGTEAIALNEAGELVLQTTAGEVKQHKPVVYQDVNGEKKEIAGTYVLEAGQVGFQVGAYDRTKDLVIDPVIVYATATGFSGVDGNGPSVVAVDQTGCAYVGKSEGPSATPGAYENGKGLSVTKINAMGTAAVYTVNLYGTPWDWIQAIAVDSQGNCYLTGQSAASTFVTTPGAFQTDYGITCGGCRNAYVTKINPTGSALVYSTFLKGDDANGSKSNVGQGIAVDAQGNAYITGYTNAKDFPTTPGAFQPNLNTDSSSARDAFVTKLNPTGTALVYSTFLGAGDNTDDGRAIAVDVVGNAYVTGLTGNGYSGLNDPKPKTPFPRTPGSYQSSQDVSKGGIFLSKLNATGSGLIYSTIIGKGGGTLTPLNLAVDANGNVYLASSTQAKVYPVTLGAFQTSHAAAYFTAFVTKVNATGSGLVYSTFVGGDKSEGCIGISLDPNGNATIAGTTDSTDFPQTGIPESNTNGTGFIAKLNATGSALLYSRFNSLRFPQKIVADSAGDIYLTGRAAPGYTYTPGAYQTVGNPALLKMKLPKSATTVSAANYSGSPLASEAIVSTFGTGLATVTRSATALPLPTMLGGTTIKVRDSAGMEREAALFFASPTQMNFQIPPSTANGNATITITAQDGATFVSNVEIANVAPSLFSADATGRGLAAAHLQRGGSLTFEPVVKFDITRGQFVAVPIDLGPASEQVYLILYGTGLRLRSSLSQVTATIGGVNAPVSYAGAQNDFVGLDQVNILIPRSLIGRGLVDVILHVEGKAANTVKVNIK